MLAGAVVGYIGLIPVVSFAFSKVLAGDICVYVCVCVKLYLQSI